MNKKLRSVLILVVLAVVCLTIFAGCRNANNAANVDYFDYSEDNIGLIGKLVLLMHKWIGNYGWTVVVFTLFLKVIMLPLDFWQRYASRKSTLKMQKMQPIIEEIDRRYGPNTQRSNQEKQKLYKKSGFSMMSTCLPMILSMVIFFVMFAGLRNYSTYSTITSFRELSNEYYDVYYEQIVANGGEVSEVCKAQYEHIKEVTTKGTDEYIELNAKIKAIDEARKVDKKVCDDAQATAIDAVKEYYVNNHESWLWIQNVWQPDTWVEIMPKYDDSANGIKNQINLGSYPDSSKGINTYNIIQKAVLETGTRGTSGKWNGLMILPFMSIGLSFLSMYISQLLERKNRKGQVVQNQQQAATNKTMMIIMPLMMAVFGFMYTGAFAIYMVVNYTMSILTMVALRTPVEKIVEKKLGKEEEKNNSSKASYMR